MFPIISGYDHVGIRVTNASRAIAFYRSLGFELDPEFHSDRVAEMATAGGARINLIFNGVARPEGNVLLDEPIKWPGFTHGAFIVDSLKGVIEWADREGVQITEGPVDWDRRLTCFLRDPDGNVLEFNELVPGRPDAASEPVLHEYPPSGNCYKVRLTAAHLGLVLARKEYNIFEGGTRTPDFLRDVNPNGRIPVLEVGGRYLPESNAICFYLATGSVLLPQNPLDVADVLRWMFFEQYNHEPNFATLYVWRTRGEDRLNDAQRAQIPGKLEAGHSSLRVLDQQLTKLDFLVGGRFGLADICLYPYTQVAEKAGFDLSAYPNVRRWLRRVADQPGHTEAVPMPDFGEGVLEGRPEGKSASGASTQSRIC